MKIKVMLGDITKIDTVDAIVSATKHSLRGGDGIDGAIHRAAGPQLMEECLALRGCNTGEAKLTKAYRLPCKYVIHTVGPLWRGGKYGEEMYLASCYRRTLLLAAANGIRTIAFPAISTGTYRYPKEEAAKIAIQSVQEFLLDNPDQMDQVVFVLNEEENYQIYCELLESK
ncbi:MAG: macro domain-containing protein [Hespellia sp.]|nr:macro domain-containing protein [Hespellia sp.]